MTDKKHLPELLAPAGSFDALKAAVRAGADAVYFGLPSFNARINAANFPGDEFEEAVSYCREHGVKSNITLNTLVFDRELPRALYQAQRAIEAGADALIVADIGLACEIKKRFPDAVLHASTQMCGENSYSAKELAKLGFSRMVCARELTLEALKETAEKSPVEIEMFIHGALCVSHSGMCLLSSVIGGRSGNRGLCAQPCRLPYKCSGREAYPLSLKDLCLASHITEILGTKVVSLKIEGRMKSPTYVEGVTSVYRKLLDERRDAGADEIKKLAGLFSRSGFTDGYFTGKKDGSMLGVRTEKDKLASRASAPNGDRVREKAPGAEGGGSAEKPDLSGEKIRSKVKSAYFSFFDRIPQKAFSYFDRIFVPLEEYLKNVNRINLHNNVGIALPPVAQETEIPDIKRKLHDARNAGCGSALVTNTWQLETAREAGFTLHGDMRLNVCNTLTAGKLSEKLRSIIISPEAGMMRAADIRCACERGYVIYGRLPVMTLEKCVIREITGQTSKSGNCSYCSSHGFSYLKDRMNVSFPVTREYGHRNVIYNSVPVYMIDKKDRSGLFEHYIFTTETREEVESVILSDESSSPPSPGMKFKRIQM